jgi:hypothetical protein
MALGLLGRKEGPQEMRISRYLSGIEGGRESSPNAQFCPFPSSRPENTKRSAFLSSLLHAVLHVISDVKDCHRKTVVVLLVTEDSGMYIRRRLLYNAATLTMSFTLNVLSDVDVDDSSRLSK